MPKKRSDPNELNNKMKILFSDLKTKGVKSDVFEQLLKFVDEKKTKIVLFDVPITDSLKNILQNESVMKENLQFINTVSDGKKVIHLTFNFNFPDSLYFDFTHFNSQGRKVYFNRFIQKMDSLISGGQ